MSIDFRTKSLKTERLILAVKEHPCIWDSGHPDYRSKTDKRNAWSSIANDVIDDWGAISRADQHNALLILMKRWNNVRDYYNKALKMELEAQHHGLLYKRKSKQYIYGELLKFLTPELLKNFRLKGSLDIKIDDINQMESEVKTEEDEGDEVDSLNDITFVETHYDTPHASSGDQNTYQPHDNTSEDHDFMFLKSLLPDMKSLNEHEKFEFKYAIMTAYKDILHKRNERSQGDSNIIV